MYEIDVLVSLKWALNTRGGHFMKMEELWAVLVFKKHHNFSLKIQSLYWYSLFQYADMKGLLCFFGKQNWNQDTFAHPPCSHCWANWLLLTIHRMSQKLYLRLCWIPALDNCSCSNWAEEIPTLSFLSSCPPQGGLRRLGLGWEVLWFGRHEPRSVLAGCPPSPQHCCPACQCPAVLLCSGIPSGLPPEIRETRS